MRESLFAPRDIRFRDPAERRQGEVTYCSKCGNELFDEAVICPKCGCPTQKAASKSQYSGESGHSKLTTGRILNNIAALINLLLIVFLTYSIFFLYDSDNITAPSASEADIQIIYEPPQPNKGWFIVWILIVAALFALGMMLGKKKIRSHALFCYVYLALAILSVVVLLIAFPELRLLLLCAVGLILFIPAILQVIAGIYFLQSAK